MKSSPPCRTTGLWVSRKTLRYPFLIVLMSVCPYVCMSLCLYVLMSVCPYVCMSLCPSDLQTYGLTDRGSFFLDQFHIQRQALQLLDEHVERLGEPRLKRMVPLDDVLVHPRPADDIVRFHRQEFLKGVRGAVGLEGPDLHLSQLLTAELRLPPQRLLGDKRVGADRPGVNLVIDQVMELHDVHRTDGDRLIERVSRAAVEEGHLPRFGDTGQSEKGLDLLLLCPVKDGTAKMDPLVSKIERQFPDLLLGGRFEEVLDNRRLIDLPDQAGKGLPVDVGIKHLLDTAPQFDPGPTEVGLENLSNVHSRRNPQRIQNEIDRASLLQIG